MSYNFNEEQLIKKLELQINKIEHLVVDLQKEQQWQHIFYKKKLYLKLHSTFNNNYTEYHKYLENIIADYNKLTRSNNYELKLFYLNQIQSKIFALFKILRSLKKYNNKSTVLTDQIALKQDKTAKLETQKESVEQMLKYINVQFNNLNKQLKYSNITESQISNVQNKIIQILSKKGQLEKELFSINERLKLLN